jgi:16S rRNA A1518/A1519 N6-dimethyltransferase RsmA/KsgA/DIM1 with predicted DNA glycosylase/AP lyase activity
MTEEKIIGEGTSKMPEPRTVEYEITYKATPVFMHDLEIVLGNVAYVDACKYIDKVKNNSGIFTIAILNEFINSLGNLPYRIIAPLMKALENQDKFNKYFELITK